MRTDAVVQEASDLRHADAVGMFENSGSEKPDLVIDHR